MFMEKAERQAVLEYIYEQELEQAFDVVSQEQAEALRALGVPEYDEPLSSEYVYSGCLTIQWTAAGPMLVQL